MRTGPSDSDVERILEDWLEDHAAPLPARLRTELADVPARHAQRGRGRSIGGRWWGGRAAMTAIGTVVVIVAIVVAPALIGQLRSRIGGPATSPSSAAGTFQWHAVRSFVDRNPAPDGYGHDVVWSYLYGHAGDPDATRYVPFSAYESTPAPRWVEPTIDGLYIGTAPGELLLQMHPFAGGADGQSPILAWRNPIEEMSLTISGSVEVDGSCGDGITFRVDHGSDTLQSIDLPTGTQSFSIAVERLARGGLIHFIVDPREDSRCDTTWVSVVIDAP